jgi:hypothetical protein
MALNVFLPLWGLLWGYYFKLLVVTFGILRNAGQITRIDSRPQVRRKLLTVRKIEQPVGPHSKGLSSCILMNLSGC